MSAALGAQGAAPSLIGRSLRAPPHSMQAEQALLGALLANNRAYDRVADFLRPEHFADELHGHVFRAIARRIEAGQLADVVTLRVEFENTGLFDQAPDGIGYLAQLLGAMVGIINAGEYGRLIHDAWSRRCIIDACEEAVNLSFGGNGPAAEIVEHLDGALSGIAQGGDASALLDSHRVSDQVVEGFVAAIKRRGALAGVASGYAALDRKTGGFNPGDLIILGARPSMGKTALANGIAVRAAAAGHRVLFVSAEMMASGVMARAVAALSGLPLAAVLRGGRIEPGTNRFRPFEETGLEMGQVVNAARNLSALPLRWDEAPRASVAAIRAKARRMARAKDGGLDLILVDYLGRCTASPEARRQGRVAEVSEMVRDFKSLAKELRVPVVLASQLSRAATAREDPRPLLSDLRDSGEIEQEADVVMFLHREHYYLERARPTQKGRARSR